MKRARISERTKFGLTTIFDIKLNQAENINIEFTFQHKAQFDETNLTLPDYEILYYYVSNS